jgi:predicted transcriptional regulator
MLDEVEHYMRLVYMSAGAAQHTEISLKILSSINAYGEVDEVDILTLFLGDTSLEEFQERIELMIRVNYITIGVTDDNKRVFQITPKGQELFMNYGGK